MSDANQPTIADTKPVVLNVDPGEYWWCSCGKSTGQPFCDGSHQGTGFVPQKVTVTEAQKVAFCLCKHSQNGAVCDGSHAKL